MSRIVKNIAWFTAISVFLPLLVSCFKDNTEIPEVGPPREYELTFVMHLPAGSEPSTRALTPTHERDVRQVAVMVFSEDENFLYTSYSSRIDDDPANERRKAFTVKLVPGADAAEKFKLVILANASQYIGTGITGNYDDVMAGLLADIPTDGWNVDPQSSGYKPMPMWGVKNDVVIDDQTTLTDEPIPMLRMLAKIDVLLQPEASAVFTLKSVRLYNYNPQGRVSPLTSAWDDTAKNVTDPSLPAVQSVKGPLIYQVPDNTTDFENNIYLAECVKGSKEDFPDYICIVIGGLYNGGVEETYYRIDFGVIENNRTNFLDILRNHRYIVNIQGVEGEGFPKADQAYNAIPVNIVGELIEWDDGSMEGFIIGKDCYLSVMPGKFEFDMVSHGDDSEDNDLTVYTNWSTGWEIVDITYEDPANAGWISIKEADKKGDGGVKKTIKVLIDANNAADATERKGYIHIRASGLIYKLPVYQSTLANLWLEIIDDNGDEIHELIFYGYPGRPQMVTDQKFTLKWSPAFESVNVHSLIVGNELFNMSGFSPGLLTGTVSDIDGEVQFTVNPGPFTTAEVDRYSGNPFLEKGARVEFSVTYNGQTARKSIYVRQINFAILVDDVTQLSYLGDSYDFSVKSNSEWRIKEVRNSAGIMTSSDLVVGRTGGNNTNLGEKLSYRMVTPVSAVNEIFQGLGQAGRDFEVVFEDINGVFPDETVKIIAVTPDPNCIMVPYVSGGAIELPIRKMFWMWESDWLNDGTVSFDYLNFNPNDLEAVILWQDTQGLIKTNEDLPGNIVFYNSNYTGDLRDYTLRLQMKNNLGNFTKGNAVIGVKYRGQLLWSWHIWISDFLTSGRTYTWNSRQYMDRNLGGSTTYLVNGNPSFNANWLGMFYQWGRKDPFPGPANTAVDKYNSIPIYPHYSFGAVNRYLIKYQPVSAVENLRNAVMNPDTYYTIDESSVTKDWMTSSDDERYINDYMWSDENGKKGMFDPCPYGWRVIAFAPGRIADPFSTIYLYQFNYGWWTTHAEAGYFPAVGFKYQGDGEFHGYGSSAVYWMGNAYSLTTSVYFWGWAESSADPGVGTMPRASGGTIRCMRDNVNIIP